MRLASESPSVTPDSESAVTPPVTRIQQASRNSSFGPSPESGERPARVGPKAALLQGGKVGQHLCVACVCVCVCMCVRVYVCVCVRARARVRVRAHVLRVRMCLCVCAFLCTVCNAMPPSHQAREKAQPATLHIIYIYNIYHIHTYRRHCLQCFTYTTSLCNPPSPRSMYNSRIGNIVLRAPQ